MYDIFLGGPWERRTPVPYKSIIKAAFPQLKFYDPETVQAADWFVTNLEALERSTAMIAYIPEFPASGVTAEMGFFYAKNALDYQAPLERLVIIWPEQTPQKPSGISVAQRLGQMVTTPEEAVERLKEIL